ncbi:ribbon-helix-helix domain-containing protein [Planctellipticum variicoloris]|uniref:ribbon-helix-helix domain-containing protein n=1 Tax=Planctellipticum variicoloris TaxID=3064265 RepID=UPI002CF7CAA8|nr:hypothetical protein SH412_001832 [Planctomycetaceae bacterium SH412]HTN04402.1 hypothetical protein [Planctomycetaceae bacterium]
MTITLPLELDEFLKAEVAAGRFGSVEDAVRGAVEHLRLVRAEEGIRGQLAAGLRDLDEGRASEARTADDVAAIRLRILQKATGQQQAARGA